MFVIGLTGGIASGKSTALKYLESLGARVWDADQISRQVVKPAQEGNKRVREHFGDLFFDREGNLDRKRLGDHIFRNPEEREQLNALLHPLILQNLEEQLDAWRKENVKVAVVDAPLLLESSADRYVDEVWVVSCGEDEQIRRLMHRDSLSMEQAERRLEAQMSDGERRKLAQRVIDTHQPVEDTRRLLRSLYEEAAEEQPE